MQHGSSSNSSNNNNSQTLYATMRPASGGRSLVTLSTYEERQEALKRTTMMEDDVNHRTNRISAVAVEPKMDNAKLSNGSTEGVHNGPQLPHIPPPPPQFANSPPKSNPSGSSYKSLQKLLTTTSGTKQSTSPNHIPELRPPSSPVPDYDPVQMRATMPRPVYGHTSTPTNASANNRVSSASNHTSSGNRRTMRLGTVTIGEYEHHQRKEPAKLEFIGTQSRNNEVQRTDSLRSELQSTLSRSNLKKSNGHLTHQSNCPLQNGDYEHKHEPNVDIVAKKLQQTGISMRPVKTEAPLRNGSSTGILKNGSRNSSGSFAKNTEKSITFGN